MASEKSLTYDGYLRLPSLLNQQEPATSPPAHDEMVFITIHQVYELWFKALLFELTDARDRMLEGEGYLPRVRLQRCLEIERVLHDQLNVLDTMTPQGFREFRDALGTASGFQSVQFREIELLSGLKDPRWPDRLKGVSSGDRLRLRRRVAEPSLWDGFLTVLEVAGFGVSTREQRFDAYRAIAREREDNIVLWELAEALVDHDQAWSLWRTRHALAAERQIGSMEGTGGSSGADYLRRRVGLRFYPELWETRGLFSAEPQAASR
jgi:tryptophan 2,3-dioxygenase